MKARNMLLSLMGFLALSAIGGGGILIISPDGKLMGMPLSILKSSPFNNFLLPGLLLFFILGLAPAILIIALIKKPAFVIPTQINIFSDMHWAWTCTIYTGFALAFWIQTEMVMLRAVHWLHTFYMVLAAAIIFTALLPTVRSLYKNNAEPAKDILP
jgi:hypothetical protein